MLKAETLHVLLGYSMIKVLFIVTGAISHTKWTKWSGAGQYQPTAGPATIIHIKSISYVKGVKYSVYLWSKNRNCFHFKVC